MATASSPLRIAIAAALVLATTPASAAPPERARIAVLPLVVDGELPTDVRAKLDDRMRGGLDGNDREIIDAAKERCTTDNCWKQQAKRLGARHFVEARVTVRDRDYEIAAELVDGRTGKVVATTQTRCEICGFTELGESMDTVTGALQRKLAVAPADPPMLVVRTKPPGATVLVDGEPVGTTPLSAPVAAGPHEIVVRKPGHIVQRRRIVSVDGVREAMTMQLADAPQDAQTRPERSRVLGIVGWSAFAAGLATVGAGIGLLVVHDDPIRRDCDGPNVDIEGNCKYLHDTRGGGIAATVIGAALVGTGIALVVVDRKRGKPRTTLSVGPRGVRLSTRF